MNPKLEETIYVDFITSSPTTGAATDADSTPSCEVFEDATDTAIITPTPVKRTGKTGDYRVQLDCTAANGFEAAKSYNVVVSATVGGIAAKAVAAAFQMRTRCIDDVMPTYTQPTGFLAATFPSGTIANTTNITAGTLTTVTTATNLTTNNDKTGYALTAAYDPAKTAAQAGDAMTLTVGERTSVGTAVWASATRTLTSFGTLAADVWASVSRTLTAFAFTVDTNANATETAIKLKTDNLPALPASTTNITAGTITTATNLTTNNDKTGYALTAAYDAAKTAAQAGDSMNVSKINGATVAGTGQPADLWRGA